MAKGTASTGKHQALRRRVEILEARIQRKRELQMATDTSADKRLAMAKEERKLKAELAGLNRLGFEGV